MLTLTGIAVQMATDLGLHLPIESDEYGGDHAFDTAVLNQQRHSVFWTVYAANM